jgi:branched-chain amino acid transport system ATP-binding protein
MLLEARRISKSFAGITALTEVDLEVDDGERVGLIGPNGAGKTTLFNCILGVSPQTSGSVHLQGEDISGLPVYQRARRGIGRTFQRIELFPDCTVRDHLLIADRAQRREGGLLKDLLGRGRARADEIERCDAVLDRLGLGELADEPIERLSLGGGRLVEVGRALMTKPKLLLLDEPSSGLDREETAALARTLRAVQADQGFAVLLVEHDVEFVAAFTDRAYVLDFGRLIASGKTHDVLHSDEVRRAYLGDVSA